MEFWKSLCFLIIGIPILIDEAVGWDYTTGPAGPKNWTAVNEKCGGNRQSPIDYISADITYGETSLTPLTLKGYTGGSKNVTLKNTGGTLKVEDYERGANNLTGPGLPGTFTFIQLHFHWGRDSNTGSEHMVEGKAYPLELHFVHYNLKYPDIVASLPHEDGLAVLGVFFEVTADDNPKLKPMLDYVAHIEQAENKTKISQFNLLDLMPEDKTMFYRNKGSLTTPPCSQAVTWTVFNKTLGVSLNQLQQFRSLKYPDGSPMLVNWRPVEPVNSRKIQATFGTAATPTTPTKPTTGSGAESLAAFSFAVVLMSLVILVLFN